MKIDLSKKLVFQLKEIYKDKKLPFPEQIIPVNMNCTELYDQAKAYYHSTTWFITADGKSYPGNIIETFYEQV